MAIATRPDGRTIPAIKVNLEVNPYVPSLLEQNLVQRSFRDVMSILLIAPIPDIFFRSFIKNNGLFWLPNEITSRISYSK